MRCVVCKSSDIRMKEVEEEIRSRGDIFLFPMQVLVCSSCGERYYDRKAMRMVEEMRDRIEESRADAKEVGRILRIRAA